MINQFICRVFPGPGKNYLRFVIKLNFIKIFKKQLRVGDLGIEKTANFSKHQKIKFKIICKIVLTTFFSVIPIGI